MVSSLVFVASEIASYTRLSATFDEPGDLAAGYAALALSDYRLDIEHPPLGRMWTALPLLGRPVKASALADIDRTEPQALAFQGPFDVAHRFLYRDNDADALLYRARFMTVLLGVLLGWMVVLWTLEWLGWRAALVASVLYLTEPNIAAHSALATNDLAVACMLFGSVYFAWRCTRRVSLANGLAVAGFGAAAALTKFSGLITLPLVALLLGIAALRRRIPVGAAAGIVAAMVGATVVAAWAAYGFRFAPSATPDWTFSLHAAGAARLAAPWSASIAGWLDVHRLLPNALVEGFIHSQGLGTGRPAYLLGEYSPFGWWYYFPVAIALKTPVVLLALLAIGIVTLIVRGELLRLNGAAFLVIPIVVFLAGAMASALNIGVRHVLPIYPFMIVLAAAGGRALFAGRPERFRIVLAAVAVAGALEFARAYPDPLSFFNAFAGGPREGFRYLADSNVDWGEGLKPLAAWMRENGVRRINLAYFGTADPAYYGIDARYIAGSIMPELAQNALGPPELPGYVAVSANALNGVFDPGVRQFYGPLLEREPVAEIGGAMKVYRIERPWW